MRIAVTGCGWVTPRVAGRIDEVLAAYAQARPAPHYEPIPQSLFDQFPNLPAEAAKEAPVRLAAIALEIACAQAGLKTESHRKGLVVGNALAGVSGMIDYANDVRDQSARFVSPIRFPQTVGNYICGALARCYDFRGPASTIACGSASSLEALREGCALLSSNQADAVIAGGCECLSPQIVDGLDQKGVRYADGACFMVLERHADATARNAAILATLVDPQDGPIRGNQRAGLEFVAGFQEPGAVSVEEWTGRTLGADGAAAVASAIGVLRGSKTPGSHPKNVSGGLTEARVRAHDLCGRDLGMEVGLV